MGAMIDSDFFFFYLFVSNFVMYTMAYMNTFPSSMCEEMKIEFLYS
jgi:hypothetical protein